MILLKLFFPIRIIYDKRIFKELVNTTFKNTIKDNILSPVDYVHVTLICEVKLDLFTYNAKLHKQFYHI